jgi:hypothetical protein
VFLFCLWITILKKNKNISCNLFIFAYLIICMKKTIRAWSIVVEWEHEDGTWNTETITDIDNMTSNVVDEFLTEYEKTENEEE